MKVDLKRARVAGDTELAQKHRRCVELRKKLLALPAVTSPPRSGLAADSDRGFVESKALAYHELMQRIRNIVARALPLNTTLSVVSKGDNELLKMHGRRAWHFPGKKNGDYTGHHPSDSAAAIEDLETARKRGAEYILFPSTADWWLTYYSAFRKHLETQYSAVVQNDACVIFGLSKEAIESIAEIEEQQSETWIGDDLQAEANDEVAIRLELAMKLSALGRDSDAAAVLAEGLRHDPLNPQLLVEMMRREYAHGNSAAAARYRADALAAAPDAFVLHFEIAKLAWQQGRFAEVEDGLTHLVERCALDARAANELIRFYCSRLEGRGAAEDGAMLDRMLARLTDPKFISILAPEVQLRASEILAAAGMVAPAVQTLRAALPGLDFKSEELRAFVCRLLRPAVTEQAHIPFNNTRALAAFLTHIGNGFAASQQAFKAAACYRLALAAEPTCASSAFNLAFDAMSRGEVTEVQEDLAGICRIYGDDSSMIRWPSDEHGLWPRAELHLAAAFEQLKPRGVAWPKITVITPSFNQSAYVEETLLSVLHQHYPHLQYIVIDGVSTDGTVEILRRYESKLSTLLIEPDEGQTDAINKGLRLADGEIITWINSDDLLAPGGLFMLALTYLRERADVIAGFCMEHSERRFGIVNLPAATAATFNVECLGDMFNYWFKGHFFYQPEVAFTRRIIDKIGGQLDTHAYHVMDYELWLRCAAAGAKLTTVRWPIGLFRKHAQQKTASMDPVVIEQGQVRDRFIVPTPGPDRALNIQKRLRRAFAPRTPRVHVVSTRASKIFSPDTARELKQALKQDGLQAIFHGEAEKLAVGRSDIVLFLVHLYKEIEAIQKLREAGHRGPLIGWFWDNHHHVFDNFRATSDLDMCIPGHAFAKSYLRSPDSLLIDPVPLCTTQWSAAEAARFFDEHGMRERSDNLYGGFVRYACAKKRNRLVDELISAGTNGVYLMNENALDRYFGMSLDHRFAQWAKHKVSLCLPLSGDLSQRFFDALLAGQIPIVPDDVHDLDDVVPIDLQQQLPVVRFSQYTPAAVHAAQQKALRLFDSGGEEGILRRHKFALDNHTFSARIRTLVSGLRDRLTGSNI